MTLTDRLAVVTGASRGIGLAIADALRSAGARVVRLARSLQDERGERFTDIPCDLTVVEDVGNAARRIIAEVGVPDIVVNNAGGFLLKPLVETEPEEFAGQIAINLVAPFLVLRALLPHMIKQGRGDIVTIGSVADHKVLPGNTAYGASKRGLRALHDVLREEIAGTGVRLTLISPGATDTRLWDALDLDRREDLPKRASMLHPPDVADAVVYAVSQPPRVQIEVIRLASTGC